MNRRRWLMMAAVLTAILVGTADLALAGERARGETGLATVYAGRFHGKRTASGERYDKNGLTAAHKTLPFGTRVKVTRVDNGKSVVVRVNDRGPHPVGRIVDMSAAAAARLGMRGNPMARVRVEVLPPATRPR